MSRNAKKFRSLMGAVGSGDLEAVKAALGSVKDPSEYADANPRNGEPPMRLALRRGHASLLEPLLDAGARLNPGRDATECLLKVAAEAAPEAAVAEFVRLRPMEHWTEEERLAAVEAAAEQNRPAVLRLLTIDGLPRERLAHITWYAAMRGHAGAITELLALGHPPDAREEGNDRSETPLHCAAGSGMAAAAACLLDAGADPDALDQRGRTPLMHAVEGEPGSIESRVAKAVSSERARVDGRVIWSAAPPEPAPPGRADTAFALLLEAGADAKLFDADGNDALSLLQQKRKQTYERGGTVWPLATLAADAIGGKMEALAEEAEGKSVAEQEALWAEQDRACDDVVATFAAALKDAGARGRSPADDTLAAAVQAGDAEAAAAALAVGGSVGVRILTRNGHASTTPLGFAASRDRVDLVRLLLDAGGDPDAGEPDSTPLAYAAQRGRLGLMQVLLEAGANPNGRPGGDPTSAPLTYAGYNDQREAIKLLKAAGAKPPKQDEPFKPGVDLGNALTEMVVQGGGAAVAQAVADHLGGEVVAEALDSEVIAAVGVGAMVVQLDGSAWSSVLPHTGFSRIPDDQWTGLAAGVSRRLGVPAVLVCYEDVSGSHGYWVYEGGEEVEAYEQDLDDADLGDSGRWETRRGTPPPADLTHGVATIQALAEREVFTTFESKPGGTPGEAFLFSFPGDRRPLVGGWYVRKPALA